jgi:hypothetical protein
MTPKMLILRGISGDFPDPATNKKRKWTKGALDEPPALAYAKLMKYEGQVLDVSGEAFEDSPQVKKALEVFRSDKAIAALYGFSGGGYNVRHVLDDLTADEKKRIRLVVVLGAPKNAESLYKGPWTLVYRKDPPAGHMWGPRALIDSFQ